MNYQMHYDLLISKALKRDDLDGYTEKHHIIPKCMGGTDDKDNLVILTAREHFIAHQLLVKIYPDARGLVYAAFMMSHSPNHTVKVTSSIYSILKSNYSHISSIRNTGLKRTPHQIENIKQGINNREQNRKDSHYKKVSESLKGRKLSEHTINRIRETHTGKIVSEETRKKMSIAHTGKIVSEETRNKSRLAQLGKKRPQHLVDATAKANKGKKRSIETRKKMSDSRIGYKMKDESKEKLSKFFKGKTFITEEGRNRISIAHTGKIVSEETRLKQSKSIKASNIEIVCPHCGKKGKLTGMKSWHFEYCKENPNGRKSRELYSKKHI